MSDRLLHQSLLTSNKLILLCNIANDHVLINYANDYIVIEGRQYQFGITSLLEKRDYIQTGDKVTFKVI